MADFKSSEEHAMRRAVRREIRKSRLLTRTEKDITLTILNLWFHHKGGNGFIHPSKTLIAKRAKCSERSVKYCLQMLKASGIAIVIANEKGGRRLAPHYRLSIEALAAFLNTSLPIEVKERTMARIDHEQDASVKNETNGDLNEEPKRGQKCTPKGGKILSGCHTERGHFLPPVYIRSSCKNPIQAKARVLDFENSHFDLAEMDVAGHG